MQKQIASCASQTHVKNVVSFFCAIVVARVGQEATSVHVSDADVTPLKHAIDAIVEAVSLIVRLRLAKENFHCVFFPYKSVAETFSRVT